MKLFFAKFMLFLLPFAILGGESQVPSLEKAMQVLASPAPWQARQQIPPPTKRDLILSIEMARAYLLNHQNPEGNFLYSLDLRTGYSKGKDNQVRQAGALWATALLTKYRFNEPTRRAAILGIDFFEKQIKTLPSGDKCLTYPGMHVIRTGTVALYCLALMDFLEGQAAYLPEKTLQKYRLLLATHLEYLKACELPNGSWSEEYNIASAYRMQEGNPYFDGEVLLVYCKAARSFNRKDLLPRIEMAIPKLIKRYTLDCWKPGKDDDDTKGFYQWACMAFTEYTEAGFQRHRTLVRDAAMALSWWIIYENDLVHRMGNTAYSVEGLIAAWRIAKIHNLQKEQAILKDTAFKTMARLMTLQFQGPYMKYNRILSGLTKAPPNSDGAITNGTDDLEVRIDTVQHQIHAMLLMSKYLF